MPRRIVLSVLFLVIGLFIVIAACDKKDSDWGPITPNSNANLVITKKANKLGPSAGETVTYTIILENEGDLPATNILVKDTLAAGIVFTGTAIFDQDKGSYDESEYIWTVFQLDGGKKDSLIYQAEVQQKFEWQKITNYAQIISLVGKNNDISDDVDSFTIIPGSADLKISKVRDSVDFGVPNLGDFVTYTISVENLGPAASTVIRIKDEHPEELVYDSSWPLSAYNPDDSTWIITSLNIGETATLTLEFKVVEGNGSLISPVRNCVYRMYSFVPDPNPNNDTACVDLRVNNPPYITSVSVYPDTVNNTGNDSTVITALFEDIDQEEAGNYEVTFRLLGPGNEQYMIVLNDDARTDITHDGAGIYTATYTYSPNPGEHTGTYDLYFGVEDAGKSHDFVQNENELTIAAGPVIRSLTATPDKIHREGMNQTIIEAEFSDADKDPTNTYTVQCQIDGPGGRIDLGAPTDSHHDGNGNYTFEFTYDPDSSVAVGSYDLQFTVNDGTYEHTFVKTGGLAIAAKPVLTSIEPDSSTVNKTGDDAVVITALFTDEDAEGIDEYTLVFKLVLGAGQWTIGPAVIYHDGYKNYAATYTYDPDSNQQKGLYDLYFSVDDGSGEVEFKNEYALTIVSNPVVISVSSSPMTVHREGSDTTNVTAEFKDDDAVGQINYTVQCRIDGPGGLIDLGAPTEFGHDGNGNYTVKYEEYDPDPGVAVGSYDMQFTVNDGSGDVNFTGLTPLTIASVPSITSVTPSPDRVYVEGTASTFITAEFTDIDEADANTYSALVKLYGPEGEIVVGGSDSITHLGSGSYTAVVEYDPETSVDVGAYDIYFKISDDGSFDISGFDENNDALTIDSRPTITGLSVDPSSVDSSSTDEVKITALFEDLDLPGDETTFTVEFWIRLPDDTTELKLGTDAFTGGVLAVDPITGNPGETQYIATFTFNWDPLEKLPVGTYDLLFKVADGVYNVSTSFGGEYDNLLDIQDGS